MPTPKSKRVYRKKPVKIRIQAGESPKGRRRSSSNNPGVIESGSSLFRFRVVCPECFNITLTEHQRQKLNKAIFFLNLLHIYSGTICAVFGYVILWEVIPVWTVVKHSASLLLPFTLMFIGVKAAITSSFGIKICWLVHSANISRRHNLCRRIFLFNLLLVFLIVFNVSTIMSNLSNAGMLTNYVNSSLDSAIKQYKFDATLKQELDYIQSRYHCCGLHGPQDWYVNDWVPENFLPEDVKEERQNNLRTDGSFRLEEIPFSCCSSSSTDPCFLSLKDSSLSYQPNSASFVTKGCLEKLVSVWGAGIAGVLGIQFSMLVSQLFILVNFRVLQTSFTIALQSGSPFSAAPAYFIFHPFDEGFPVKSNDATLEGGMGKVPRPREQQPLLVRYKTGVRRERQAKPLRLPASVQHGVKKTGFHDAG